jgi:hypothetical protein
MYIVHRWDNREPRRKRTEADLWGVICRNVVLAFRRAGRPRDVLRESIIEDVTLYRRRNSGAGWQSGAHSNLI